MEFEDYLPGEQEITEILLDYWLEGKVSSQSIYINEDYVTVEILWHAC